MGETVPPGIAMLIVGSITSVSLAALFIGGLVPAAVMALCLMVLIYVRARRAATPRVPRASFATMLRAGLGAVLPLLMPAMLLGGILFGVATPTEVAAFSVVYCLLLVVVGGVLREGRPALNVLAPLLTPIAGKLGLSDLHYALVLIIAMGIGGFMPLAGVGFYVCCAIMRCDIDEASRAMVPYVIVVLIGLIIVAFVPWFALALPKYFGFRL